MNPARRTRLAPYAYALAALTVSATAGWAIVNRQFDTYVQVGLGIAFALAAAGALMDPARLRAALGGRQARYGSNAVLVSLAFAGILAVLTYLAITNTKQLDLTEDKQYTLTTETQLVLSGLKGPVEVIGFYTPDASASRDAIRPLLDQYRLSGGGKLSYRFVDPRSDPVSADRYGVTRDASVVVVMGEASEVTSFATEKDITEALVRLANPEARKVYFLVGHGERDLQSAEAAGFGQVRSALESKNYEVASLNLVSQASVPEDARAVVVAGPTIAIPQAEMDRLTAYLGQGGSLVVLLDPVLTQTDALNGDALLPYLTEAWGVEVRPDLIVDLRSDQPLAAVADQYASHPISERLGNLVSYFPGARSLGLTETAQAMVALVITGSDSWGKADPETLAGGSLDFVPETDNAGPLTIVVVGEQATQKARLAVFGDSDFASNADFFSYANGDLLINTIDWASRQESLISLTPKQSTPRFVTPPTAQAVGLIFLLAVIVIPGVVVAAGVYVWLSRRRRA
ncbi:MAG: hypothetical protein FJZ97_11745 [Chloroflexi bacterium]|nr:hypothetical protein [Chloroflexota bacterium]